MLKGFDPTYICLVEYIVITGFLILFRFQRVYSRDIGEHIKILLFVPPWDFALLLQGKKKKPLVYKLVHVERLFTCCR